MKKRAFLNVSSALEIPGATFASQHTVYKSLASLLPKSPRVLEIGCGCGRSTWAWLDVLPKNTLYYVLDNFKLPNSDLLKWKPCGFGKRAINLNLSQREIFDNVIKKHPNESVIKKVWHVNGADWINSRDFTTDWDLVYIDDDHSYNAVKKWLENFSKVPIVCGDDYRPTWPGVVKAVDDYSINNSCVKEIMPGAFFVIKNT